MQIDAVADSVTVHVGETFSAPDAEKLQEAFTALGPFSRLEIDFASVRRCDDAALARLASTLLSAEHGAVRLRGLTPHQWRLLTYMGLEFNRL
jgi:anti-anti-sigma regulatory factor